MYILDRKCESEVWLEYSSNTVQIAYETPYINHLTRGIQTDWFI